MRLVDVDELEVTIEKLVAGGEGLARYEGIAIFVPRSAPGDRLRVRLVERRPDYGRAEIIEVLDPGPGRRQPPCPYFAACGGCDLQHLEDDLQLRLKAQAVRETLERLAAIPMPEQVAVEAGERWAYRLRTQLHAAETLRGVEVGYHARGSQELVPVEHCAVLSPPLEAVLRQLPRILRNQPQRRIDLVLGDGDTVSAAPVVPGLPHGEVTIRVGEFDYHLDARCFFQGHRTLLPKLVAHTLGAEDGEGEGKGEEAYDLYAGVGLFSLPLAARYERVVAVEGDRIAARFARLNAHHNQRGNLEVVTQSIETWITGLPENVARVIVDPPRAGLSPRVRGTLLARRPRRLTYVSCHAAALARDLRSLSRAYQLDSLALIDLFPQTGHMEVVAQLSALPPAPAEEGKAG